MNRFNGISQGNSGAHLLSRSTPLSSGTSSQHQRDEFSEYRYFTSKIGKHIGIYRGRLSNLYILKAEYRDILTHVNQIEDILNRTDPGKFTPLQSYILLMVWMGRS